MFDPLYKFLVTLSNDRSLFFCHLILALALLFFFIFFFIFLFFYFFIYLFILIFRSCGIYELKYGKAGTAKGEYVLQQVFRFVEL